MRAADIVAQLQIELPKRTAIFTNDIPIVSLTRSGSAVTAVSSLPHGLVNNQEVVIVGARELNPITSLTFADGIVSAVAQNAHDLTEPTSQMIRNNNLYDFNRPTISGADQADYNGTFLVSSVPTRKSFTYAIDGLPVSPATGSPVLEQDFGYNGKFPITVVDPTTFTYQISSTPVSPAGGTIIARSPARISSAKSLEDAKRAYTKQLQDKLWTFVVLGDVNVSKDRSILSDATTENSKQNEWRDRLIEPFNVYIFVPAVYSMSGRDIRDDMETIRGFIYHALLGVIFPTGLSDLTWSMTSGIGDRYAAEASDDAVYVHEFSFQRVVDVTYKDTKGPDTNRALRDIDLNIKTDLGEGELTAAINFDE